MQFLDLKKNLKKDFSSLKRFKVVILGDTATQLISQALRGYGFEHRLNLEVFESDYDQIERQILDRSSFLHELAPDFIVIFQATQKLLDRFYRVTPSDQNEFGKNELEKFTRWILALEATLPASKVIVLNFPELDDAVFGNYANKVSRSFPFQVRRLNLDLMYLAQSAKTLSICDVAALQNRFGSQFVFDARLYIEAEMVFSLDFLPTLAKTLVDIIQALSGSFKKALVMDLDNTLWGGVIGDDGIEGIQIGDLGQGKAFTELQKWARQLKQRGILLAICSKNTEQLAREPFSLHPEMTLKMDDIAMFVANWDSKIDNLKTIQAFLNIGFDSMVFLDDSSFERNLIRQHIPEITVPELPVDPAEYVPFLRTLNLFESSSLTAEDDLRTRRLRDQSVRLTEEQGFTSEVEFLASLQMSCRIRPIDSFSLPRVAQLVQRSNQFNLRTIRYSEEELSRMAVSQQHLHLTFSLTDKLGDLGLISVVILERKSKTLFIDTWIMSCRVLRRGVEALVLNSIVVSAMAEGFMSIVGEYRPTAKNQLVKDHYLTLGFTDLGAGYWTLDINNYVPKNHSISAD